MPEITMKDISAMVDSIEMEIGSELKDNTKLTIAKIIILGIIKG